MGRKPKGRAPPNKLGGRLGRVYDADLGVCHLCHLPVPPDLPLDQDLAPSVDHLIPKDRGGSDAETNLRLAHRLCNWKRGSRLMAEIPPGFFDNIWR